VGGGGGGERWRFFNTAGREKECMFVNATACLKTKFGNRGEDSTRRKKDWDSSGWKLFLDAPVTQTERLQAERNKKWTSR